MPIRSEAGLHAARSGLEIEPIAVLRNDNNSAGYQPGFCANSIEVRNFFESDNVTVQRAAANDIDLTKPRCPRLRVQRIVRQFFGLRPSELDPRQRMNAPSAAVA